MAIQLVLDETFAQFVTSVGAASSGLTIYCKGNAPSQRVGHEIANKMGINFVLCCAKLKVSRIARAH